MQPRLNTWVRGPLMEKGERDSSWPRQARRKFVKWLEFFWEKRGSSRRMSMYLS